MISLEHFPFLDSSSSAPSLLSPIEDSHGMARDEPHKRRQRRRAYRATTVVPFPPSLIHPQHSHKYVNPADRVREIRETKRNRNVAREPMTNNIFQTPAYCRLQYVDQIHQSQTECLRISISKDDIEG